MKTLLENGYSFTENRLDRRNVFVVGSLMMRPGFNDACVCH